MCNIKYYVYFVFARIGLPSKGITAFDTIA